MHILILGNNPRTLVNFNGTLIETLLRAGHHVTTAGSGRDLPLEEWLTARNVRYFDVRMERTGMNPLTDLKTLLALVSLMREIRPDFLLAYMIKPVVYGLIAAWLVGVRRRSAIITGLGYAFTDDPDERGWLRAKRAIISVIARVAYFIALRLADTVIFQNPDDRAQFKLMHLTTERQRIGLVNGSGVDLCHYRETPLPEGPMTFLMIARLLRDKGVYEFVEAARLVKQSNKDTHFGLVGPFDPNPTAIKPHEIDELVRSGIVEYHGAVDDVRPHISKCHVFVLPSYREGTPRTVLEAMAMGRPIITTDVPGCRETVIDGVNGHLVKVHDAPALAKAMLAMISNAQQCPRMARSSLDLARTRFDAVYVADCTIETLGIKSDDTAFFRNSCAA